MYISSLSDRLRCMLGVTFGTSIQVKTSPLVPIYQPWPHCCIHIIENYLRLPQKNWEMPHYMSMNWEELSLSRTRMLQHYNWNRILWINHWSSNSFRMGGITVVGGTAIVEGMDEDSCLLVKAWNEEFFPFYTLKILRLGQVLILLKLDYRQKWAASVPAFNVIAVWNERR